MQKISASRLQEIALRICSARRESRHRRRDGEFALLNATSILLLALRAEDTLFALNLNDDIEACEHDVSDVWWKPPDV